jgi:tRNA(Ile)-lysidine synthase
LEKTGAPATSTATDLHQSQQLIDDYSALLYSYLVEETPDGIQVDIPKLKKLPHNQAILYELIHPFGFTAWEDIYGLLEAPSGKKIFSKNYTLLKDRTLLMIQKNRPLESGIYKIHPQQKEINEPIRLRFTYINDCENVKKNIIFVDQQKLKYPLHLRKWQEGDYFYPLGLAGKKKLSKFFKDEKLSLFAKQKIWLLCDADDHIVWVIGYRMDHRYKISDSTKTKVKIELIQ